MARRQIIHSCGLTLLLFLLTGCLDIRETAPPKLQGTWTAAGSIYEGRSMVIDREQITFDSGDGEKVTHEVIGVLTEEKEGHVLYALDYRAKNGGEYRLHFRFESASGELRFVGRQHVVWQRVEA